MMKTRARYPRLAQTAGFTLIEVIVVIVLIAGILAVVGGKIIGNKQRAEARLAQTQLQSLSAQIDQYQADVGSYPDSLEQLVSATADGWLGPYAKPADFKDPWHNPIDYRKPGDNEEPFKLVSLGADGKTGGEGVDKDVSAP